MDNMVDELSQAKSISTTNCCLECGKVFKDERGVHVHLRTHLLTQEQYYLKHWPRVDLLSLAPIPFISFDQYFEQDFTDKENFLLWLKTQPKDITSKYLKSKLLKRKSEKNLRFAPSQIELRSTGMPGIGGFLKSVGDYYSWAESIGFESKFQLTTDSLRVTSTLDNCKVYVDTREKNPLRFQKVETVTHGLKYGDYVLVRNGKPEPIRIERKSLIDFISTFSKQVDRFHREVERAKEDGGYLVVVVEDSLEHALIFNLLPHINRHTRINPQFVFHHIRQLIQEFDNLQFLFVKGRYEATNAVLGLSSIGDAYKYTDLQYAYDSFYFICRND